MLRLRQSILQPVGLSKLAERDGNGGILRAEQLLPDGECALKRLLCFVRLSFRFQNGREVCQDIRATRSFDRALPLEHAQRFPNHPLGPHQIARVLGQKRHLGLQLWKLQRRSIRIGSAGSHRALIKRSGFRVAGLGSVHCSQIGERRGQAISDAVAGGSERQRLLQHRLSFPVANGDVIQATQVVENACQLRAIRLTA